MTQSHGSELGVIFPIILGHEGAGYVRKVGSKFQDKDIKFGGFVLLSINYCSKCKQCRHNVPICCHNGGILHMGAMHREDRSTPGRMWDGRIVKSQFVGQSSFAAMSVVEFDENSQEAAFFAARGCDSQTGAGTVLNVSRPGKFGLIVVFGLGRVDLTVRMAAKYLGVGQIVAFDLIDGR